MGIHAGESLAAIQIHAATNIALHSVVSPQVLHFHISCESFFVEFIVHDDALHVE